MTRSYVVTGAASGIGAATAAALRELNHEVVTVDRQDADVICDLSTRAGRSQAIASILTLLPSGLDGFVACAGVSVEVSAPALIPKVNYFGTVELVKGLQHSLATRRGAAVLLSSNSAWLQKCDEDYIQALLRMDEAMATTLAAKFDGQSAYIGGKQALCRWLKRHNTDYARLGIRMNAIAPGFTETGMTQTLLSLPEYREDMQRMIEDIPLGTRATAQDQADAIMFLLSERARFISGSVLYVDGGYDARFRPEDFLGNT